MLQVPVIKVRDIKELQEEHPILPKNTLSPLKKRKKAKSSVTNSKIIKEQESGDETVKEAAIAITTTVIKKPRRSLLKSALKETPPNQKRIDSYFTSCPKTYDIKFPVEDLSLPQDKSRAKTTVKKTKAARNTSANKNCKKSIRRPKARRKRLFTDSTDPSAESMSVLSYNKVSKNLKAVECIIINSDSEDDNENNIKNANTTSNAGMVAAKKVSISNSTSIPDNCEAPTKSPSPTTASSLSFGQRESYTSCEKIKSTTKPNSSACSYTKRKTKPCPVYKIIENTTFAVDAFQFGYIENVTDYFLTHFHADHYIGLTKSFAMPLYMSPITARLLRTFIPVQEQYINELELNIPYLINGVEVTALDANHCPGSILIVFKFPDTGKCILHTGDFRASHEMESEPIFWNNHINTIYLDTTYISDKYSFCTQHESIMKAQSLIEKFMDKHAGKRILYICGSYIIGKEKFWSSLAEKYDMKIWTEGNRYKALKAINDERYNRLLVEDPKEANMHVIPMAKLSYLELIEYFKIYEEQYDIVFALRPSGWEKDAKPRYGTKINFVGIEYSEHSSYEEMQRFVKFLKPDQVISTVPRGKDLNKTSQVPLNWYKYDMLKPFRMYQPSIDSFMAKTPQQKTSVRLPNTYKGGVDVFVSPITLPVSVGDEESYSETKKESPIVQSPLSLQNHQTATRSKIITKPISIASSSEDFEKSEFIVKSQQRNKKEVIGKIKSKTIKQTKAQRTKNQLKQKNIYVKTKAINSEEYFETPEEKLNNINSDIVNNIVNTNGLHYSSEDDLNNDQIKLTTTTNDTSKEQRLKIPTSQKRITKTKKALTKSTKETKAKIPKQTKQNGESLNSKSRRNYKATSQDSISTDDEPIKQQDLKNPTVEKRITRSKSASSTKAEKLREQNVKLKIKANDNWNDAQEKPLEAVTSTTPTHYNTKQENYIFQSTSNSSVDAKSGDEMHLNSVKNQKIIMNSPKSSEDWLDKFEYTTKSFRSKRNAINLSSIPLKRTKPNINTQAILKTILEQREDLHRLNCSQLAGLVVDTVNKHNPDYSKDHIPVDLLSDADDDWM